MAHERNSTSIFNDRLEDTLKHIETSTVDDAEARSSLFKLVDADKSGTIDKPEFDRMYNTIKDHVVKEHTHEVALEKQAQAAKRRVILTGCFGIVMSLFLGLSVTFNYFVVFGVVDSQMRTTTDGATGVTTAKGSDTIAAVRLAEQELPLTAAPLLSHSELEAVSSLSVTMDEDYWAVATGSNLTTDDSDVTITVKYSVIGYVWLSQTRMFFRTATGDEIHIDGSTAWVRAPDTNEYSVCAGNATCASFSAGGVDVDALQAVAASSRRKLGHHPVFHPCLPPLCLNTCGNANDDYCDDGGPGAEYSICALGTDCNDCGTTYRKWKRNGNQIRNRRGSNFPCCIH